jgi:hypothetical protein
MVYFIAQQALDSVTGNMRLAVIAEARDILQFFA